MTLSRQSNLSKRNMSSHPQQMNACGMHTRFQPGTAAESVHQRCKRRLNLGHLSYMVPTPQTNIGNNGMPTAVAKRNERERKRVRMVNNGFTTLRQHVPSGAKNKKLSKVETLRSAIDYIKHLQQVLGIYDMPSPSQNSDIDISLEEEEDEQASMESSSSPSGSVHGRTSDGADENVFPSSASYVPTYISTTTGSYSNANPIHAATAVTPYHGTSHYDACQYQGNYTHVAVGNCSVSPSMGLESNCHSVGSYNSGDELLNGVTTWFN